MATGSLIDFYCTSFVYLGIDLTIKTDLYWHGMYYVINKIDQCKVFKNYNCSTCFLPPDHEGHRVDEPGADVEAESGGVCVPRQGHAHTQQVPRGLLDGQSQKQRPTREFCFYRLSQLRLKLGTEGNSY